MSLYAGVYKQFMENDYAYVWEPKTDTFLHVYWNGIIHHYYHGTLFFKFDILVLRQLDGMQRQRTLI